MEKKINIIEIIKDCPIGTKLYSPLCGECRILSIYDGLGFDVICGDDTVYNFSYDGRYNIMGECCIFPSKECRDWSKFQRPFKDGDILISGLADGGNNPFIFKQPNGFGNAQCYCAINCFGKLTLNDDNWTPIKGCRLATEEEKQKLFQAIKDNGYKWNEETKTLEKLPKFKVGDRIKKCGYRCTIKEVREYHYLTKCGNLIAIANQDNWELVPNKFDITTLKPFDKVLVRGSDNGMWCASIFSHTWIDRYFCVGTWHNQCIPYEGNEYLLGTTNNYNEFYKTW